MAASATLSSRDGASIPPGRSRIPVELGVFALMMPGRRSAAAATKVGAPTLAPQTGQRTCGSQRCRRDFLALALGDEAR